MAEPKEENLIDLSLDCSQPKSEVNAKTSDSSLPSLESNRSLTSDQSPDERQLCGYLSKLSARGPLRAMRRRWFAFNSNNCVLYYYRTRDDLLPLGDIDIKRASFTIKSQTVFTIISLDREMTLEASDSQQCLHWLTSLQTLRKKYIIDLAKKFGVNLALNHVNQDINYDVGTKNGMYLPLEPSKSFHLLCPQTNLISRAQYFTRGLTVKPVIAYTHLHRCLRLRN